MYLNRSKNSLSSLQKSLNYTMILFLCFLRENLKYNKKFVDMKYIKHISTKKIKSIWLIEVKNQSMSIKKCLLTSQKLMNLRENGFRWILYHRNRILLRPITTDNYFRLWDMKTWALENHKISKTYYNHSDRSKMTWNEMK